LEGDEGVVVLDGEVAVMARRLMEVYGVGSVDELVRRLVEEKFDEVSGSSGPIGARAPARR